MAFNDKRVLLVEDIEINQLVAEDMLLEMGLAVDIVENGVEALDAVQKSDYDAILMDIHMPLMDGLEATKKIRQLGGKFLDVPIIAVTANALEGDEKRSLDSGMNEHTTKPIIFENLQSVMEKWIKN
jgi:CheY-like chemotaxis protein